MHGFIRVYMLVQRQLIKKCLRAFYITRMSIYQMHTMYVKTYPYMSMEQVSPLFATRFAFFQEV